MKLSKEQAVNQNQITRNLNSLKKQGVKLKLEYKLRWLEALRDGGYKQGKYQLVSESDDGTYDEFCCLGVILNIEVERGYADWVKVEPENKYARHYQPFIYPDQYSKEGVEGGGAALPSIDAAAVWFREGDNPSNIQQVLAALAGLNDLGLTFRQIASVINKEL